MTNSHPYTYRSYDVVAYTYQAELLCPDCTAEAVQEAVDKRSKGGVMPLTDWETTENYLDRVAGWFVRDRYDEHTYDSDEFPKVVFADQIIPDFDHCGQCGEELL